MRKELLSLLMFAFLATQVHAQCGNLYIGGVIDATLTGGVPKGVQICASANVADISIYGLGSANNGGGTDGEEFTFPAGSLDAGQCIWVASEATNFTTWFGFAPCFTSGAMGINGDDAIELFCNGAVTDLFGDPGTDGNGECWEYLDGWGVNNTGAANGGTFDCADWTFSGPNALDGQSSNAGAGVNGYPSPAQTCPMPLPITLSAFNAKKVGNNAVQLDWTTASEEDNEYFAIEYSNDGRTFSTLDIVEGAGTSFTTLNYSYTHDRAETGNNYYRLLQVDFSGASSYSDVVVVALKATPNISVRPTFAKNDIFVVTEKEFASPAIVEVFNLAGQRVLNAVFPANAEQIEMKVDALENGHYFIRLTTNESSESARFIKF